jgi:Na+-translocating ferredoxin:NAD+ oxidoreductase subunit B
MADLMSQPTYSISALANEFDISSRTIRFYEEKGLLSPLRTEGNQRRYTRQDRFRLKWILRGKRFGYRLDEIAKMVGMTDTHMDAAHQIRTVLSYGEKKILEITDHIQELKIMRNEMVALKQTLIQRLTTLEGSSIKPQNTERQPSMTSVYKQLAAHLDQLPGGFPPTKTGVELNILRRLFSPEEAQVAIALTLRLEDADTIASRLKTDAAALAPILDDMSRKGLIFRYNKKDNPSRYMAAQFVIGIWEYQVNGLDKELIEDFNAYVPTLAHQWMRQDTQQLRVIPISKSVSAQMHIMPYEAAEEIILKQSKIVVAPCICRKEHRMMGKGCDNPLEVCLCFGSGATYYEENGLGRSISKDEALDILQKGIDAGLVLQPGNAQQAINICMCCGCCCQVLKQLKALPQPAKTINSSYYATVTEDACIGCGICEDRCHMQAITVGDTAVVDLDRCIGCGACVPTCDTKAITLQAKPDHDRWVPPKTAFETYFAIAKERGLF